MPQYQLQIHQQARDELDSIEDWKQETLVDRLHSCSETREPTGHNYCEMLKEHDLFRVKAGDIRAICKLEQPVLLVLLVDKRDTVYNRIDTAANRL